MWKNQIGGILVSLSILIGLASSGWRLEHSTEFPEGMMGANCSEKVVYVDKSFLRAFYRSYYPTIVDPTAVEEHFLQSFRAREFCIEETND